MLGLIDKADTQDNLWIADYHGNQIAKLDAKTGELTFYKPPNPFASPYGITVDRRRGHIWYADTNGNNATRFDPTTGEFVEYQIPTRNSSVRFMGIDPKGRVWYGGFWTGKLGMIDTGEAGSPVPVGALRRSCGRY